MVPIHTYIRGTTSDTADDLMQKAYVWDLKTWVSTLGTFKELITGNDDFYEAIIPELAKKKINCGLP